MWLGCRPCLHSWYFTIENKLPKMTNTPEVGWDFFILATRFATREWALTASQKNTLYWYELVYIGRRLLLSMIITLYPGKPKMYHQIEMCSFWPFPHNSDCAAARDSHRNSDNYSSVCIRCWKSLGKYWHYQCFAHLYCDDSFQVGQSATH